MLRAEQGDVLRVSGKFDLAGLHVGEDAAQSLDDLVRVGLRDNTLLAQHGRMGNGAGDVLLRHALVKGNGRVEIVHQVIGGLRKAAAPEFHMCVLLEGELHY